MQKVLKRIANGWRGDSLAGRLRRRRFELFLTLLSDLKPPIRILDVGGHENFWKAVGFTGGADHQITLLNLRAEPTGIPNVTSVSGDARDLREFVGGSFDVVFSNSVIEHVGGLREQQRMAREVQRVGLRYFVQTPSRWFPMEPHFLVPFFQFFPLRVRAQLHHRLDLGWWKRQRDYLEALAEVESIRLLTAREMQFLFPGATLHKERLGGLVKSYVVCGGWGKGGWRG